MISTPTAPPASETWHRVDVCKSAALARTQISLIGVLDVRAIETIDEAVWRADVDGHALTFDLGDISSITPGALAALLSRGNPPYDGPLDPLWDLERPR